MKTLKELMQEQDYVPEFIVLYLADGQEIRGLFIDEPVDTSSDKMGREYVYDIRHYDDDDSVPATVEKTVRINRFGTIFCESPIHNLNDYIEVEDWDFESWEENAKGYLQSVYPDADHADIAMFITDCWENLDTNLSNGIAFDNWCKEQYN